MHRTTDTKSTALPLRALMHSKVSRGIVSPMPNWPWWLAPHAYTLHGSGITSIGTISAVAQHRAAAATAGRLCLTCRTLRD